MRAIGKMELNMEGTKTFFFSYNIWLWVTYSANNNRGKLFYADGEVFIGEWAWGRQLEKAGQIVAANEALRKNLTVANSKLQQQLSVASMKVKKNVSDMLEVVEDD